jgi:hypothetical protein
MRSVAKLRSLLINLTATFSRSFGSKVETQIKYLQFLLQ